MNSYIVYTDGSYMSSIDCGGGASIILDEKENVIARLYQGFKHTTNNRMEIRAVLETLKFFKEPTKLHIISDSMYVIGSASLAKKGIEENDLSKKNLDLGFQLADLLEFHDVTFEGTKGHVGNKGNEEADKGCTFAAQCLNLKEDIGTIDSQLKS